MQSRRDQVQAYFFVVGRLISALMRGRPDEPSTPTRRFVMGAVIGTLLGCLVVAGFGVYGLIRPGGNTSWQQAGAIIVEKETGARYLYLQGKLRPVLNYSSALLAANNSTGGPQVKLVSQNSLQGVARATPIGIPGAPDSLPDAENLSRAPWVVCATTESSPAGTPTPITDLQVRSPVGTPLGDDEGVLVSTPDGAVNLIWQGKKLRMPDAATMNALSYSNEQPFPVTAGWINTLPSGPDLVAPQVPGAGNPVTLVNGEQARVGQVFEVRNEVLGTDELYLLREDGFAPLNATLATLLLNDPANAAAHDGQAPALRQIGMDVLNGQARSGEPMPAGFPGTPPSIRSVNENGSLRPCAVFQAGPGGAVRSEIGLVPKDEATGSGQAPANSSGPAIADRITVTPSSGALVRDQSVPGVDAGTLYLVSNVGVKYPLPSPDVAGVLGYSAGSAVPVPSALLSLLPTGPSLDPAQANVEQPVNAAAPPAN